MPEPAPVTAAILPFRPRKASSSRAEHDLYVLGYEMPARAPLKRLTISFQKPLSSREPAGRLWEGPALLAAASGLRYRFQEVVNTALPFGCSCDRLVG